MFRSLLCIQFVAVAFRSEEEVLCRRGTPVNYFGPALDPSLGGCGRKTTTLVGDLEYFIHTKFHQNPLSGSEEEVENVNCLTEDGRTTDAGQRVITIGYWSLWLLCPKNLMEQGSLPLTSNEIQTCITLFVVILPFWHFCWCRGFCHRTESDLFLFS